MPRKSGNNGNGNSIPENGIGRNANVSEQSDDAIRDALATGQPIVIDPVAATEQSGTGPDNDSGGSSDNTGSGATKRRRGRPRGSGTSSKKSNSALDITALEALLLSTHGMLASLMNVPELALDQEEAKHIAVGAANVARHYDIGASQKMIDWSNLIGIIGMAYGTRLFAIRNRKRAEKINNSVSSEAFPAAGVPSQMFGTLTQ